MVRETTTVSMEIKQETARGLSIGTVTFDLEWSWTVLVLSRWTFVMNITNTVTDAMLCSA